MKMLRISINPYKIMFYPHQVEPVNRISVNLKEDVENNDIIRVNIRDETGEKINPRMLESLDIYNMLEKTLNMFEIGNKKFT
jgi:hypothetical protein